MRANFYAQYQNGEARVSSEVVDNARIIIKVSNLFW